MYKPTVWRHSEVTLKLLLERGKRTMRQRGKLLDGYVVEDMAIDNLLEIAVRRIHISQHLCSQATLVHSDHEIYQFGHLQALRRSIVHEVIIVQRAGDVGKEVAHR